MDFRDPTMGNTRSYQLLNSVSGIHEGIFSTYGLLLTHLVLEA